jgi:guanylate kinase
VNEDLDQSCARVRSILAAARQRRDRFTQMESFVKDLQNQIDSL